MTDETTDTDPSTEPGSLARYYPEIYATLEYAIAPERDYDRGYFIRQTLDMIREHWSDHPNYDDIVSGLERALRGVETGRDADVLDDIRGVYGLLPYRREAAEEAASSGEDVHETADTSQPSDGRIQSVREAFKDIPKLSHPTDQQREFARMRYPPEAVPDEGPIPDPDYEYTVRRTIDVPLWVAETVAWKLRGKDEPVTEVDVYSSAFDYAQPDTVFTILDGKLTLTEAMEQSYGIDVEGKSDDPDA